MANMPPEGLTQEQLREWHERARAQAEEFTRGKSYNSEEERRREYNDYYYRGYTGNPPPGN